MSGYNVSVRHACVRAPRGCVSPPIARRVTGGINSSAGGASAAAKACLRLAPIGRVGARWAAGRTWTSRTLNAPWAGRFAHTSVVDAAGVIYVIGGYGGGTYYQDVWASTDGGARPDSVNRDGRWVLEGYLGGTQGYSGVV